MRPRAVDSNWLPTVVAIVLLFGHSSLCWNMINGWAGIKTRYPILTDDHTFNYYYAVTSRTYLSESGSTAGYDPFFMSGYAKSIIFPSSSTMAELVVWLFGGEHPERAYKLYVVLAAMASPLFVWCGAWIWLRHSGAALVALILYLTLFWSDLGEWYIRMGMVPFVLANSLAVLATACFVCYLYHADNLLACCGMWLASTFFASLATMIHLTIPIAIGPIWIVASACQLRARPFKVGSLLVSALLVVLVNLFWLYPAFVLWETKGRTDTGFINLNVMERLLEIARGDRPIESVLVVSTLLGTPLWFWRRILGRWELAGLLVWLFFLGYLAGWIRALDFLQPGRYTQYFYTLAVLPSSLPLWYTWRWIRDRISPVAAMALASLGVASLLYGAFFFAQAKIALLLKGTPPFLPTTLPAPLEDLIVALNHWTEPGERLLFEERNLGITINGQTLGDPYQSYRVGPLLPLLTGLEVIGGPYLYTHHRTNFTQVGDGKFFAADAWDRQRFERLSEHYDLQWMACWSPAARLFLAKNPDLFELTTPLDAPIVIARLLRQDSPAIIGTARVQATPGRLSVTDAKPENGELVLRYHWTPGLVSDPPLTIDEYPIDEDPVGLIRVRNPPPSFTIKMDPWQPLRFDRGTKK